MGLPRTNVILITYIYRELIQVDTGKLPVKERFIIVVYILLKNK